MRNYSLHTDEDDWLNSSTPHSAMDALACEIAIRDALKTGVGRCGMYVVSCNEALATVSNDGYLLVLGSPKHLKGLIAKLRARRSQYLADPEATFIRKWLANEEA